MSISKVAVVEALHSVLNSAWSETLIGLDGCAREKEGPTNAAKSALWVKNLGTKLCHLHDNARPSMRPEPGSVRSIENEFLFDIVVHSSPDGSPYTGKRLWAVESEFERTSQAVRRDLAKLFWADVENRLFIYCAANPNFRDRLEVLKDTENWEKPSRGSLFACALPHPADWKPGVTWEFKIETIFQAKQS